MTCHQLQLSRLRNARNRSKITYLMQQTVQSFYHKDRPKVVVCIYNKIVACNVPHLAAVIECLPVVSQCGPNACTGPNCRAYAYSWKSNCKTFLCSVPEQVKFKTIHQRLTDCLASHNYKPMIVTLNKPVLVATKTSPSCCCVNIHLCN